MAPRRLQEEEPPPQHTSTWGRRALFGAAAATGVAVGAGAFGWSSGLFRSSGAGAGPQGSPVPDPSSASQAVTARTARGTVTVEAVAEGVTRIRISRPSGTAPRRHSYAIETELPPIAAVVGDEGASRVLTTPEVTVAIDSRSGAITARRGPAVLLREAGHGFEFTAKGYRWQLELPTDETCHGLGQRAFPISLRNRRLQLWNYDAGSYQPGADPLYLSIPFYLGHRPDVSYGILWDNPARGSIDLASDNTETLTYECELGEPEIYLITGDHPQQVVQRLAGLTGRMELPPLWALGYQQSRWSYRDDAAYRAIAARMRAERIPCDALHFDIDYMDGFRMFTWDRSKFPHPRKLLADLAGDGFQSVAILDPGVKADRAYAVYRDGRRNGVFLRTGSGARLTATAWAGRSEFPDFTAPRVREWWAGQVRAFAEVGFAGFWNDMNEPSTFLGEHTLPDDTPHDWDGEGNTHVGGGHAVYGMQMARASRDGLSALRPERRPFVISRAGYAGLQRYAATWNGDSRATWEHLQLTIPQMLNLGMSGVPFSGSDAGGFRGDPDAELYLRWMQLASMTPFFRTHSARTARERNPWTFGAETTDRVRSAVELRYRLLPYVYTAVERACSQGIPIVRPMFFERPDAATYQHVDDQFMLGDDLLVAPVLEKGARSRSVLLPPGSWYRFDHGVPVAGDRRVTDSAGLELPLYVRAGTVVPTWPVRQTTASPVDRLILCVYAGEGRSELYEDAGDGYDYREAGFRRSTFTVSRTADGLTVAWARDGGYEVPYDTVEVRVFGATPTGALVDGRPVAGTARAGAYTLTSGVFGELHLAG